MCEQNIFKILILVTVTIVYLNQLVFYSMRNLETTIKYIY